MPSLYWKCDGCGATLNTESRGTLDVGTALQVAAEHGWKIGKRPEVGSKEDGLTPDLCPTCREVEEPITSQ